MPDEERDETANGAGDRHDLRLPARAPATWSGESRQEVPEIFVDAGDLPWGKLQRLLRDALADLTGGGVLELTSGDGETYDALAAWCEREGHALARRVQRNGLVSYLIGKDEGARGGNAPETAWPQRAPLHE